MDVEHALLSIKDLTISFGDGPPAVDGLSLEIRSGQVLGVAGRSGSGKSLTALAAMGLLPPGASVSGSIKFKGRELLGAEERDRSDLRGSNMTMVFQETTTALNPLLTIGKQLVLAIRANVVCTVEQARARAIDSMHAVLLEDPERLMARYPHELSGGMCQRVMIAMALSCGSELLFADEPTTALDVTVQREVLDIIRTASREHDLAVMFISHDLGVLDEISDHLVIIRDGKQVEFGTTRDVIDRPVHAYTRALLASIPKIGGDLVEFPGFEDASDDVPLTVSENSQPRRRWWRS